MDELRRVFESLKLRNVETFIASGNVLFEGSVRDAARLEGRIERALTQALTYDVGAFIRSIDEVTGIAAYRPFGDGEPAGSKLSVVFLKSPPDPALRRNIDALRVASDDFYVNGREVYWLCRGGRMSESPVGVRFGKVLGTNGTMRNVTTIRKLVARHAAPPSSRRTTRRRAHARG
jgi:uncharacterized protein (DUF1697 family)